MDKQEEQVYIALAIPSYKRILAAAWFCGILQVLAAWYLSSSKTNIVWTVFILGLTLSLSIVLLVNIAYRPYLAQKYAKPMVVREGDDDPPIGPQKQA